MPTDPSLTDTLEIDIEMREANAIVRLSGSANMAASTHLREQLLELIRRPSRRLVVDLGELAFMSSVALSAIIAAHLECRHRDCSVHLVAPQASVMEMLEITRLNKVFAIHPDLDKALHDD